MRIRIDSGWERANRFVVVSTNKTQRMEGRPPKVAYQVSEDTEKSLELPP